VSFHQVITNCTSRKRMGAEALTLRTTLPFADIQSLARAWQSDYCGAPRLRLVRDLYLGRSFSDAYKAARLVDGELFVVSSGLGLAHELDDAPSYDLTFADTSNPLAVVLHRQGWTPAAWWDALNQSGIGHGPLWRLVESSRPGLILIALPSGYLEMVSPDLLHLSVEDRQRLRIFSSSAGSAGLHAELQCFALPYDDRLEAISGHNGTRTDFPQRALRHFVEELEGHRLPLLEARARVESALDGLKPRHIPARTKLTDTEIANVMRKQWKRHKGSSTQLLRYLRQEAQIACEQKRFRGIWQGLKAEYAQRGVQP
jgi:hypothetical protein